MLTTNNLAAKNLAHQDLMQTDELKSLRTGIWLYLLLLLFEGALRKWFLPMLSTPLLLVRDPIAIWLVLTAWKKGILTSNFYLSGMIFIGLVSFFTSLFLGHQNLTIAIYGARIFIFHFPLIFVIGKVLNREDVIKIGKFLLWVTIPMTILIAMQFYSPQSALVNRGVGGDMEGAGFSGSNGYFRPPATFSFITGTVQYYGLVAGFILYFLINSLEVNKLILTGSLLSLFASVPFSISRTMLFQVIIAIIFLFFATIRNPKYLSKMAFAAFTFIVALIVLSQASFFQTAAGAFTDRFEVANESEGGMKSIFLDRFLGGMIGALTKTDDLPFFGYGIGMGTNFASRLLARGQTFLISEEEWGRLIGELGALLGILTVIIRFSLCIKIAKACYLKLTQKDFLPWMLLSFGFLSILQGQWAQPTSLGFSVMIGGLMIASLKDNKTIR